LLHRRVEHPIDESDGEIALIARNRAGTRDSLTRNRKSARRFEDFGGYQAI